MKMVRRLTLLVTAWTAITTARAADQMAPHFDPDAARALMQQGEQRALSNRGPAAEVLATGNYVYIRVERAEDQVWLAAPRQEVPLGSEVRWGDGVEMHDFKSHQLDRFFHKVVFVDRIAVGPPK